MPCDKVFFKVFFGNARSTEDTMQEVKAGVYLIRLMKTSNYTMLLGTFCFYASDFQLMRRKAINANKLLVALIIAGLDKG